MNNIIRLLSEASFAALPVVLQKFCSIGTNEVEKDLLLISTLGTFSGCLNSFGVYDGNEAYPNLFVIIIAPPGNGKNIIRNSKSIAKRFHDRLLGSPNARQILIPANSSSAALYDILFCNKGAGVIFESEVDTLSQVLKQEWGSFSDLLRKGYHQEASSLSRVIDMKNVTIECPRFSMVLSGTPRQLYPLVDSVENGLFSRLTFMILSGSVSWKDVSPLGQSSTMEEIDGIITKMVDVLEHNEKYPFELTLSEEQWSVLNEHFKNVLEAGVALEKELAASIKRLGLMVFKICIILSAFRRFQNNLRGKTHQCMEDDFDIAIELSDSLYKYMVKAFGMYEDRCVQSLDTGWAKLLSLLPDKFTWQEAVELGKTRLNLAERTVGKYLKILSLGKYLIKDKPGYYMKNRLDN